MKTNLKLGLSALAFLAPWAAKAQDVAAKVATAVASGASGVGPAPDGRFPIIVWAVIGGVLVGFIVGYMVGSARGSNSSN
jgi:hypothetical protein